MHIVFDSDLDREKLSGDECERTHSTRCNVLLDSPDMFMPKTLCRSFKLNITDEDGKLTTVNIENNRKRAYDIKVGKNISKIELIPETNRSGSETTTVFSFDFR